MTVHSTWQFQAAINAFSLDQIQKLIRSVTVALLLLELITHAVTQIEILVAQNRLDLE